MAGAKVQAFLKDADYDTFYELAHELSMLVIADLSGLNMMAGVIIKVSTSPDHAQAKQSAESLADLVNDITEEVREYFFPDVENRNHHERNRVRWSPYNTSAWDTFYAGLSKLLTEKLALLDSSIMPLKELPKDPNASNIMTQILQNNFARLTQLAKPNGFEQIAFKKDES